MRKIIVLRDGPAEPWKVRESRVRRERENSQDRTDRNVVENALSGDRPEKHGQHALITGLPRNRRRDAVSLYDRLPEMHARATQWIDADFDAGGFNDVHVNNIDEIKLSFKRLLNIVPENGMVLINGDDHNCVEVAKDCRAQMVEVGFSKNCAQRIRDVAYSTESSRFKLGDDVYEIPMVGEFNVRNAAMAATAARFYDVPKAKIDKQTNPKRVRFISRHSPSHGSSRNRRWCDGD